MYALVLAVTCLHRHPIHEVAMLRRIGELMARLYDLSSKCQRRLEVLEASCSVPPPQGSSDNVSTVHQMLVSALNICIEALRGDFPAVGKAVDSLARRFIDQFCLSIDLICA